VDIVTEIAEAKIKEAIKEGEFDNLPGKGKPLKLEDLSRVPEQLRAAYILLKNAEMLPVELELKKEIVTLQKLVACCTHEEKAELQSKLNERILRFNILMEKRRAVISAFYRSKILLRFSSK